MLAKTVGRKFNRRKALAIGATVLLAGCQVIPKTGPETTPTPTPSDTALPGDTNRHRVALLVPLSGSNGSAGQSIANAATMALLDTNADNLRITTYDTASGAESAAASAIADGNKLILGPLLSGNVSDVLTVARPANVPLISFSNDTSVAARDVFVMGIAPDQSIARAVSYAQETGSSRFAALIPNGTYGARAEYAFNFAVQENGGSIVARETYDRGNTSILSAAQRLRATGGFDTVLIADGARLSIAAAGAMRPSGNTTPRLLGTELWSGESSIANSSAMEGAMFATVSDSRFGRFSSSYRDRFGGSPHRIATLGYDAVLLTLRIAREWTPGRDFPVAMMRSSTGFVGIDGPFRFGREGVADRAMEVRQVGDGRIDIISPAPTAFDD